MGCGSSSTVADTGPKQDEHSYTRKAPANDQRNGSAANHQQNDSANGNVRGRSSTVAETGPKQDEHSYTRKAPANDQRNGSAANHQQNDSANGNVRGASASSRCTSTSSTASKLNKKSIVERESSFDTESRRSNNNITIRQQSASGRRDTISNKNADKVTEAKHAKPGAFAGPVQTDLLVTDDSVGGRVRDGNNSHECHESILQQSRDEKHEERARYLEERRSKVNLDEDEARTLQELGLQPLSVVPHQQTNTEDNEFTIDDILNHNNEVGTKDWFKYGHRVYSAELMLHYVKDRMEEYKELALHGQYDSFILAGCFQHYDPNLFPNASEADVMSFRRGYPIRTARYYGVTRLELNRVLSVSLIGKVVEIDHVVLLARFKQSVENTIQELEENDSENANDFRNQLNRWLQEYPSIQVFDEPPQSGVDPNEQTFPLPKPILFDPLMLRRWAEDWEALDTEVAEDGAWSRLELVNEDLGDTHETFAALVKSHVDENIPDLDMSIDGEAGWNVIETDLLKNDTTTEEQDKTLSCRAKRKNINDPEWMEKRRSEIADSFIARHEMDPSVMSPFLSVCQNLETGWKQFQTLVEDNFIPPKRTAIDTSRLKEHSLKKREKSLDSIISGVLSDHGENVPQMYGIDNTLHFVDNNQENRQMNNKRDGNTVNTDDDELNNSYLSLADDGGGYQSALLLENNIHEPGSGDSALESDTDPPHMDNESTGDQVDDNRHAVDMEASGIHINDDESGVDEKSDELVSPTKTPDPGGDKSEPYNGDTNISPAKGPRPEAHVENNDNSTEAPDQEVGNRNKENETDNLALVKSDSQVQEDTEMLMNELEFENDSSSEGNIEF